jgi:Ser/Thr protein kinase RdoA (MazF antagonist)
MGDCNDANLIVSPSPSPSPGGSSICGLIDFSDSVLTWSVNEVAIAMAYGMLSSFGERHRLLAMGALLFGYLNTARRRRRSAVADSELQAMPVLVAVRLAISFMVGRYSLKISSASEEEKEYLKVHSQPSKEALHFLWELLNTSSTNSLSESDQNVSKLEAYFIEINKLALSNNSIEDEEVQSIIQSAISTIFGG